MSKIIVLLRRTTYLLYNLEAVRIVPVKDVRAHEGEHRHDVVKHRLWSQPRQTGDQQQRLMERLRVFRGYRK